VAQLTPDPTPVLLTIDVEIAYDRDRHEQTEVLWCLVTECKTLPATWFCTADAAELFSAPLRALIATGHSIGCHGYDHGDWEDYRYLSPECVLQTLSAATQRIEAALGVRPRVFRGPRMTTSAATHAALRVLGYVADFSVCAWRFDVMVLICTG
jgi:peptidoglycan/xylan/chitin deacetylase (PgdA/CDA1 family)